MLFELGVDVLVVTKRFFRLLMMCATLGSAVVAASEAPINKIAFGSCLKQHKDLRVLESIASEKPDLFVFAGDNVYADTLDTDQLVSVYNSLGATSEYRALKQSTRIVATWDDHDYGAYDAGANHPNKVGAQQAFLDFFEEPPGTARRQSEGIYTSYSYGEGDQRVNVVLLDTRYFRSSLEAYIRADFKSDYRPNLDAQATVLGGKQWGWLQQELAKPGALTLVVSSTQLLPKNHRFEKWANFPFERKRLLDLLDTAAANEVVVVSGDRHFSELSKTTLASGRTLYEITTSGMNTDGHYGESEDNPHRLHWVGHQGFATVNLDWTAASPAIKVVYHDTAGIPVYEKRLFE